MNPLTAVLFRMRPSGFQIEARHPDSMRWTEYYFTRLSDGAGCLEIVTDAVVASALSVEGLARYVLWSVERRLEELDRAGRR